MIEGFTIGIAVIITLQQIPTALGVASSGGKVGAAAVRGDRGLALDRHVIAVGLAAPLITAAVLRQSWSLPDGDRVGRSRW